MPGINPGIERKQMKITLHNYLPIPCARPRLGKFGNVYSPSAIAEKSLAWMMRANMEEEQGEYLPMQGELMICILVEYSQKLLGDIDNIAKFIMDATQKAGIIINDKQFCSLAIYKIRSNRDVTHITISSQTFAAVTFPAAGYEVVK